MSLIFAYIDPGAGSLIIQALIAAVVSVPFFFRNAIRSTLGRLRRKPAGGASGSIAAEDAGATPTDSE
ncbi:MAG: hypothetical protein OEW24_02965 [Chloroflexota bacterium]|nr:hypothetical protein [Chloroflexota bacterium]